MDEQIINNLYEFWTQIGAITDKLISTEDYKAVLIDGSDWPNRIFDLRNDIETFTKIEQLSKNGEVPENLTVPKPYNLKENHSLSFIMEQKNMALELELFSGTAAKNPAIKEVKTEKDAIAFAETASQSFGYKVAHEVINRIIKYPNNIRLFVYQENNESLGCGIVFFDSANIAGLHMIGTLPKGRGRGIGKSMTQHLLMEAKENKSKICVLHASRSGEPIYKKFGFKVYGEIETYRILKNK